MTGLLPDRGTESEAERMRKRGLKGNVRCYRGYSEFCILTFLSWEPINMRLGVQNPTWHYFEELSRSDRARVFEGVLERERPSSRAIENAQEG